MPSGQHSYLNDNLLYFVAPKSDNPTINESERELVIKPFKGWPVVNKLGLNLSWKALIFTIFQGSDAFIGLFDI